MAEGCWYYGGKCTGMEEKVVLVLNEMSEYLSVAQMKKLQEVMLNIFSYFRNGDPGCLRLQSSYATGKFQFFRCIISPSEHRRYGSFAYHKRNNEKV